jgi:hypothetical protein
VLDLDIAEAVELGLVAVTDEAERVPVFKKGILGMVWVTVVPPWSRRGFLK